MRRWALALLGALTCPCHLPLYLGLLGSTVIGGALAAYQLWILVGMSLIFTGVIAGLLFGRRKTKAGLEPARRTGDALSEERVRSCCAPVPQTTGVPSAQREGGDNG